MFYVLHILQVYYYSPSLLKMFDNKMFYIIPNAKYKLFAFSFAFVDFIVNLGYGFRFSCYLIYF